MYQHSMFGCANSLPWLKERGDKLWDSWERRRSGKAAHKEIKDKEADKVQPPEDLLCLNGMDYWYFLIEPLHL